MDLAGIPLSAGSIASCIALSVANIDDPSAELGAIAGSVKGELRLCYQTVATADEWTLYAWDDASSTTAATPYLINGTSGQWRAMSGKYCSGIRKFDGGIEIAGAAVIPTPAINLRASNWLTWYGSSANTAKFDSQGTAIASRTSGGTMVFNGGSSADRPEISWIRGSRTYPEFSIREAALADTGGEFWCGPGTAAPTMAARFTLGAIMCSNAAATNRDFTFATAGTARWRLRCESTAEGGANAGSQFQIAAVDDAGSAIDTPLQINRVSGGAMTVARPSNFSDTTVATSPTTAAVKTAGGFGVVKQSFLGTIASTFAGNVIAGVADATTAVAGQVGEVLSSVVSGVAVATSTSVGNVTSLSLTAGNWVLGAMCVFSGGATGLSSGTTAKLSVVSATTTNGTPGSTMAQQTIHSLVASDLVALSVLRAPVQITGTNSFFLTEELTFAPGSPTASATLWAVRIR